MKKLLLALVLMLACVIRGGEAAKTKDVLGQIQMAVNVYHLDRQHSGNDDRAEKMAPGISKAIEYIDLAYIDVSAAHPNQAKEHLQKAKDGFTDCAALVWCYRPIIENNKRTAIGQTGLLGGNTIQQLWNLYLNIDDSFAKYYTPATPEQARANEERLARMKEDSDRAKAFRDAAEQPKGKARTGQ